MSGTGSGERHTSRIRPDGRGRESSRCRTRPASFRYRCMVKMRNLPDDPGEGRTMTGADGEVAAQPNGQPTSAAGEQLVGEQLPERPAAQAPAPETAAETPRER